MNWLASLKSPIKLRKELLTVMKYYLEGLLEVNCGELLPSFGPIKFFIKFFSSGSIKKFFFLINYRIQRAVNISSQNNLFISRLAKIFHGYFRPDCPDYIVLISPKYKFFLESEATHNLPLVKDVYHNI